MKSLILILLFAFSAFAAEDITDVSDLGAIKVQTNDAGVVNAGDVKSTLANYPALRAKLKTLLASKLDAEDDVSAVARFTKLTALGITLPQVVTDRINTRIEALRAKKETALLAVAPKDPARALAKMNELIVAGVPITAATQNAVKAAQPVVVPPVAVTPPDDGL